MPLPRLWRPAATKRRLSLAQRSLAPLKMTFCAVLPFNSSRELKKFPWDLGQPPVNSDLLDFTIGWTYFGASACQAKKGGSTCSWA